MAVSVNLPALGESVTEGTVTRWLKQEGDSVEADEPLLEISTDKVDTEIPAPASGVLLSIKVHEDETVEVGAELAVIGDASETAGGDGDSGADDAQGSESAGAEVAAQQEEAPAPEEASSSEAAERGQGNQPSGTQTRDDHPAAPMAEQARVAVATGSPAAASAPDFSGSQSNGQSDGGSGGGSGAQVSVVLPALGESVTEGTVTRWLKQEGDSVEADEPLLEISTDKVDTEIPAPASGILVSIRVHEDETVDVGAELAVIGSGDQSAPSAATESAPAPQPSTDDEQPQAQPAEQATETASQQQVEVREPAASDPTPAAQGSPQSKDAPNERPAAAPAAASSGTSEGSDQSAYVTPLVRKLAAERGVDLASVSGTGVGGRIRKQDVVEAARAAAEAPAAQAPAQPSATQAAPAARSGTSSAPSTAPTPSPLRGRTEKLTRLRATIAKRMVESLQVSAQLTTVVEVDVTKIARLRTRAKSAFEAREGVKLSFLPFFAKAICESLKAYPQLNASIDQDKGEVTYHEAEHLGIAVDTERGLLVATIHDAGDLNIGGLARKIADLAARTRANKVSPDELSGGTFTLTNTGSRGALFDTPIIMQPQVGILGTGAVVKRPVVIDDPELGETIAIRSMVYIALTYDHRLVDGADAARFLTAVKARLEEGAFESDLGL